MGVFSAHEQLQGTLHLLLGWHIQGHYWFPPLPSNHKLHNCTIYHKKLIGGLLLHSITNYSVEHACSYTALYQQLK